MVLDLPPPLWTPPKPAIVRPAEVSLLRPGAFRPMTRAERRAVIADLVGSKRLTPAEAKRAMLLVPVVGWAAGGGIETFSYLTNATSPADETNYSFGSLSFGAAAADRYLVGAVGALQTASGAISLSSATIGGVSTTIVVQINHVGNGSVVAALCIALVPTGTSGTVTVNWSDEMTSCGVALYRITGLGSPTPQDTGSDNTPSSGLVDVSLSTPSNGCLIAMSQQRNGSTVTFSGADEDVDVDEKTGEYLGVGSVFPTTAETPRTVTIQSADSSPDAMAGVSASWL